MNQEPKSKIEVLYIPYKMKSNQTSKIVKEAQIKMIYKDIYNKLLLKLKVIKKTRKK